MQRDSLRLGLSHQYWSSTVGRIRDIPCPKNQARRVALPVSTRTKESQNASIHSHAGQPLKGSEILFLAERNSQIKEAAKIAEAAGADVDYIADVNSVEPDMVVVWRKFGAFEEQRCQMFMQ